MFNKKTVRDMDVRGKRVLVRAPLNVPIKDGKVVDEMRLKSVIPTLKYLLDQNAALVLISHHSKEGQSLKPAVAVLEKELGKKVKFLNDCLDDDCKRQVKVMRGDEIAVLENLRFHPEEEANDEGFAKALAGLGDTYVDDDFTVMHRKHASVVGVPKYLPAVAGFLVEKEVKTITEALENPTKPLLAVVAGAKISTKIALLNNLLPKVDAVLIGGAMANTFLAAQGKPIGKSLQEANQQDLANKIIRQAKDKGIDLFLPLDVVVTTNLEKAENVRTLDSGDVGEADIIADLGPATINQIKDILAKKGTVIWNGPMGVTEIPAFRKGSELLADAIIASGCYSLIGGGDTAAFVDSAGLMNKFGFVSTGGGASLELMSGNPLPGLEALQNK